MYALTASRIGKRYRHRWVLRDVDLAVPPGRAVALVGHNGAGKTTLLHLAVGLLAPDAGAVAVFGSAPLDVRAVVGFVGQDKPLYPQFRVEELLTFGRRLNRKWDDSYARRRIEALGIDPAVRARELSGGQWAQVALTLALAKRPRLLLLDEPMAELDPVARRDFATSLSGEVARTGVTVVHSSHDVTELGRACDYLVVIAGARVRLAADVADLGGDLSAAVLEVLR